MNNNNARFEVVSEEWEEKQRRFLTYAEFLELFYTRLGRLIDAKTAIELQLTHNQEACMRLRKEAVEQAAQAQADDTLIRNLLPDLSDPIMKLIDSAIDILNQLYEIAKEPPALHPDMQASLNDLVSALSLPPALVRSAFIGIDWPIRDRINRLADLSLKRDLDIHKPNNTTQVEDVRSEDNDENPNNPA